MQCPEPEQVSYTCVGVICLANVCRNLPEDQLGISVERSVMGPLCGGDE